MSFVEVITVADVSTSSGKSLYASLPERRHTCSELAVLDQHDLEAENESLHKFYDSVRRKVADVKDREGRQELVRRLYDTFFATAFKKTVDKLGIVYTPVQIVDFILRSADEVLRQAFGQSLSDEGVHILDGFTGTGTFIVRLLELGLIKPHDLARKYTEELHANEILLLAYYIAAVNIETTYMGIKRAQQLEETSAADPSNEASMAETDAVDVEKAVYESFPGLILTDTFQSWEDDDHPDLNIFPENNDRLERLKNLPITVIVGNPPYSAGQESANDDNQNEMYPSLDAEIERSYAAQSTATSKRTLYDSYVRAFKWATLRIQDRGLIAYVTNGGFLDSNSADDMRKTLADEFSEIYVYNLRGNQRTAGEQSRREGGKVFGGGSRATVAITVLVKNPDKPGPATIHYTDVGDYLSAEQKLQNVEGAGTVFGLDSVDITPNEQGDWLGQRRSDFGSFQPISGKGGVFGLGSPGITTNRDLWVYGWATEQVDAKVKRLIGAYQDSIEGEIVEDPTRISWSRGLRQRAARLEQIRWRADSIRTTSYRPFTHQRLYRSAQVNEIPGQAPRLFPSGAASNVALVVIGPRVEATPAVLAVNAMPDLSFFSYGAHAFARWQYEHIDDSGMLDLSDDSEAVDGYRKIDNITDEALKRFQAAYGVSTSSSTGLTKDDIFFYVYGLLHSPEYRETYAVDLKKMLPRIPLVENPWPFVEAGRDLSELHLGYESVTPYPLDGLDVEPDGDPYDFFAVQKMAFSKKRAPETKKLVVDKSAIVYNSRITLSGIPEDAHRYMLGSRSAIEWIIDRYQVKNDKPSGIVNDPNDWSREVGDPRYIVDLLARIVTVSLQTVQIVDNLPALAIRKNQNPK